MKMINFLSFISLAMVLVSCAEGVVKQEAVTENGISTSIQAERVVVNNKQPETLDAAVQDILLSLPEKDKMSIKNTPVDKLSKLHHTLGRYIRNKYELFGDNDRLRISACEVGKADRRKYGLPVSSSCHPDDASSAIIEAVWHKLNGE